MRYSAGLPSQWDRRFCSSGSQKGRESREAPERQLHPELGLRRTALRCAADSHVRARGYSSPCCRPREKCAAEQPHSNSTFWAAGCSAGTLEHYCLDFDLDPIDWEGYFGNATFEPTLRGVLRFGSGVAFFSLSL